MLKGRDIPQIRGFGLIPMQDGLNLPTKKWRRILKSLCEVQKASMINALKAAERSMRTKMVPQLHPSSFRGHQQAWAMLFYHYIWCKTYLKELNPFPLWSHNSAIFLITFPNKEIDKSCLGLLNYTFPFLSSEALYLPLLQTSLLLYHHHWPSPFQKPSPIGFPHWPDRAGVIPDDKYQA